MAMPEKRNPGSRAGASNNTQTNGRGPSVHSGEVIRRLQFRLSANACAIDSLTPDLDYAMRVVWLVAKGMPLPGDAPQRLNRLALRLFDARSVLEAELPPEVGHLDFEKRRARERSAIRTDLATSAPTGAQVEIEPGRASEKLAARERQEIAGESFGSGKQLSADRRTAISDPGRASEKRRARERMADGGGDQVAGSADRRTPVADPGRAAELLNESDRRRSHCPEARR